MPGETVDPMSYDFVHRFATALKSLYTVCNLSWTCPHCGARNCTTFNGARVRRSQGPIVEAKCGKCHGQLVTLLDAKNRTIHPGDLLPRPH